MKQITFLSLFVISLNLYSQEKLTDPINEFNRISSLYLSTGMTKVHYTNYSGIYDSLNYSIDNKTPSLNFGFGYINSLYFFNEKIKNKFVFTFGGEFNSRRYKINYATENISVNEVYLLPMIGFGGRSEINHNLWLINSYKAIEYKIILGAPILLGQNAIIDRHKINSSNSIYVKYHIGLDIKFSSLQSNGKGHQIGSELFLENSKQDVPTSILFKTPYYIGLKFYYCILNKPR